MPDKLKHLLSLLDDPDEEIYLQVRNELIRFGPEILPDLEKYWAVGENSLFTTRLHNLIENIRFNLLYSDWFSWRQQAEPDLLNGAVLIDQISDHNVSESTLEISVKSPSSTFLSMANPKSNLLPSMLDCFSISRLIL